MAFKDIASGTNPLATDVQQIIKALQGSFDVGALSLFVQIAAPGAPTLADSGVAGNPNGTYLYKVTLCTGLVESDGTVRITGETQGGTTSASITVVSHQVSLTAIPTGPAGTVARRVYRTAAGGADGTQKLVATISDNVTTVYTDNVADASLGAAVPTTNTTGTTFTLARNPQAAMEAATKQYVDNHASATSAIHGVGASTVESASGSQAKVDAHAGLTAAHGATGAVVGTTNTQTVQNKTIDTCKLGTGLSAVEGGIAWEGTAKVAQTHDGTAWHKMATQDFAMAMALVL